MIYPELNAALDARFDEMVDTLRRWIQVPSVKDTPQANAPFGPAVRQALDTALADGQRLGLSPRNVDGYAMDLTIGQGEECIAMLAHLDVVPAGDGWQMDPFGAVIQDDRIYGRGVSDDKGPAVAAMYAMRAVLDAGIPLKKQVRLVLGCDEESGWEDMAYYKQHVGLPQVGFSPDACYPLINTEKGIIHLTLTCDHGPDQAEAVPLYRIRSGARGNVIPGLATAEVGGQLGDVTAAAEAFARESGTQVGVKALDDGHISLTVTGVTGHAAMPEHGKNAAALLLQLLSALGAGGDKAQPIVTMLAQAVGKDTDGSGLGIAGSDGVSGGLTMNLGVLDYAQGQWRLVLDIRHPVFFSPDQLFRFIELRTAPLGFTLEPGHCMAPHHVPASSPVVQSLLSVYHEITGLDPTPIAIGGGTYARSMPQAVAFGCTFPGEPDLAHQAGEHMRLDHLRLNARIFAHAIVALAG